MLISVAIEGETKDPCQSQLSSIDLVVDDGRGGDAVYKADLEEDGSEDALHAKLSVSSS